MTMPYSAEISRTNPTCFLFLVDQSGSMKEEFGANSGQTKAQGVADAINRLLQTLIFRCAKGEYILDRYYLGAIGYGGRVNLGFPVEALSGDVLQPVSRLAVHPLRIEDRVMKVADGAGGFVDQCVKFPVWFEPKARGNTPMCGAFQAVQEVLRVFLDQHPQCFPPVVINISDGRATDGDFEPDALGLWTLASEDGNVLLFNVNISAGQQRPIRFPNDAVQLPDDHARLLFRVSSPLPPPMLRQARMQDATIADGARGFAYNADLASIITFLDIGTRVGSSGN